MLSVPVEHPEWGRLQKCACGGARRAVRPPEDLAAELGAMRDKTFDSYRLDRPYKPLDMPDGRTLSPAAQAGAVRQAVERCRSYAEDPAGWLFIHGPTGTGKSHMGAAIANACAGRLEVLYRSTPGMLDALRDQDTGADALGALIRADLLVIDDLGVERRTDWADERFFLLFNERASRPTVITSNYDLEALATRIEGRLVSRLRAARPVWLIASDFRALQLAERRGGRA